MTGMIGMQPDPMPRGKRQRLVRATGAAVGFGVALLENCIPGTGGRIMVFTGGPCTTGPGAVVGLALEHSIRTHRVCTLTSRLCRVKCRMAKRTPSSTYVFSGRLEHKHHFMQQYAQAIGNSQPMHQPANLPTHQRVDQATQSQCNYIAFHLIPSGFILTHLISSHLL